MQCASVANWINACYLKWLYQIAVLRRSTWRKFVPFSLNEFCDLNIVVLLQWLNIDMRACLAEKLVSSTPFYSSSRERKKYASTSIRVFFSLLNRWFDLCRCLIINTTFRFVYILNICIGGRNVIALNMRRHRQHFYFDLATASAQFTCVHEIPMFCAMCVFFPFGFLFCFFNSNALSDATSFASLKWYTRTQFSSTQFQRFSRI